RNAGERIEQWEQGLEYRAADILEIDVDAFRARCGKTGGQIGCPVVDAGIEAEFLGHVAAFVWSTRNADGAGTLHPGDLPANRADRPRRCRDHHGFASGRFADL